MNPTIYWRRIQFRRLKESMSRLQAFEAQGATEELQNEMLFMRQILSTLMEVE